MKKSRTLAYLLIWLLVFTGTVFSAAQAQIPVTARIPQIIILNLNATELVFNELDFDHILGAAELVKSGVIATKREAVVATVQGNIPYTLYISAPEEYLIGKNGGLIHISQLTWKLSGDNDLENWEAITLERVPVKAGPPGTLEVEFDFRLIAFWENPAQVYTGEILLTVIPEGS